MSDSGTDFVGVDVGGTKILATMVEESGIVLGRQRMLTPRDRPPEETVAVIEQVIAQLLQKHSVQSKDLGAIGLVIPGVVDPDKGLIVVTPNMNLDGIQIVDRLAKRFKTSVSLGNDCNLGTLGEKWLGSARDAKSAVGIFVGTGIGAGFVTDGRLWRGSREAAMEIGHMVMQIGGPKCGCGNRGCFEALASRTAIEREIRLALKDGAKSILTEILDGDFSIIRSGALKQALDAQDKVATRATRNAATALGHACVTIRHLLDPEVIVLGGGVMEACSRHILPIVKNIVNDDPLPGAREGGLIRLSALGDDAVALGAVAQALEDIGKNPFDKETAPTYAYEHVVLSDSGKILIDNKVYERDIYIRVNGKVKKYKKSQITQDEKTPRVIMPEELSRVCKGGPEILFIGTHNDTSAELDKEGRSYMQDRCIDYKIMPAPKAIGAYNKSKKRKAAIIQVRTT